MMSHHIEMDTGVLSLAAFLSQNMSNGPALVEGTHGLSLEHSGDQSRPQESFI